ncbi:MAG: ferredoxin [Nocardioidaceae bacterium]|jgi:ferredoxin|nr:ferredoxin [Nocardioidaceae bacterium]
MFHVSVDAERCQGHARCFANAPDDFDFDDEGYAFVPEGRQVGDEVSEQLRRAVANCPERAVVLKEV